MTEEKPALAWKLFACLNVLFGLSELALLMGGFDEPTMWRIVNDIFSVLATTVIVLYAFGPVCFSPGLRKGVAVALSLFVVAELADALWKIYVSYTSADAELAPIGAWILLAFLCIINYFTMLATWRYSIGQVVTNRGIECLP
jgi:hypothetical protein